YSKYHERKYFNYTTNTSAVFINTSNYSPIAKPEILNTPLLRYSKRITYSYKLYPSLPITYKLSRRLEDPLSPKEDNIKYLTDIYIIYYSISRLSASNLSLYRFPSKRLDSLRRYLIDFYLRYIYDGISYT
ncbi:hypothetical protein N7539_006017, partial [Penicillium diatomitis]